MRKFFLSTILVLAAFALNAQVYLGGQLGFNLQNSSQEYDNSSSKVKNIQFAFGPEVGYSINNKLDVGINLNVALNNGKNLSSRTNDYSGDYSYSSENKSLGWAVAPYVRYSFVKFGKFKILGKASLFAEGEKMTSEYTSSYQGFPNYTGKDENKTNSYGINISPLITFQASKHFVLIADLNFLGLHLAFNKTTTPRDDGTRINKSTDFGFNINTGNLLNLGSTTIVYEPDCDYPVVPQYTTVGGFKVGFAYVF